MKRIARYLLKYPKLVWKYDRGKTDEHVIDVFSDSDWDACRRSRRSTSGGVIVIDDGTVKHSSSTQATIALSVGEAEYYALVKAAEGLAMVALGRDLGYEFNLRIWVDSTTAKAIVTRLGLGKVRHMDVKFLWAQEALRRKLFEMRKITGERNPADVLTKAMSMVEMKEKIESIGGLFTVAETSRNQDDVGTIVKKLRWADVSDDD